MVTHTYTHTHTHTHTYTHTHTHTYTHDNYYNPRCAHAHRGLITDMQMLKKKSGKLCVDRTDIEISDHFLLWLELRRLTKRHTKGKRVIKKWRLDRFDDKEIVIRYKKAFKY